MEAPRHARSQARRGNLNMTYREKVEALNNPFISSLLAEAGAFRCLNESGESIRTFSAARAATLRKDPNYCWGQLYYALPRERGEVGLKFLANQVIDRTPELKPHRDFILAAIREAMPPCQHEIIEGAFTGGCKADFATPPAGPNSLKREQKGGCFNLLHMLRHAAGK